MEAGRERGGEAERKKVARFLARIASKSQIKISGDERHLYTTAENTFIYPSSMPIFWNYTKRQKLKEKRALVRYASYSRPEKHRMKFYHHPEKKINASSIQLEHIDKGFASSKRSNSEDRDQENVDENQDQSWLTDQSSQDDFQLYLEDDDFEGASQVPTTKKSAGMPTAVQKSNSSRFKRGLFTCPECDQTFTFQHNLKRHMKNKHEGLKFKCQECTKAYTTERCLRIHIGHAHKSSLLSPAMSNSEHVL